MVFVVVVRGNGNAAAKQGQSTEDGQSGLVHRVGSKGLRCCDFCCQFVLAKGGDGVVVQPAVCLYTHQCALSLAEVVFNDQVGTFIKSDVEVVSFSFCYQFFRRKTTCFVRELVVRPMHGCYVLRRAVSVNGIGGKGIAGGVFQGQGDAGHVGFPGDFSVWLEHF